MVIEMGQVTLYLDESAQRALELGSQANGLSKSRFVAQLLAAATSEQWPEAVQALAGRFADFPLSDGEATEFGNDVPRVKL
jgi:hypothetical protein